MITREQIEALSPEEKKEFKVKLNQRLKELYNQKRERDVPQAIRYGLDTSLVGEAAKGLGRKIPILQLAMNTFRDKDKEALYEPRGALENLASIGTSIVADLPVPASILGKGIKAGKYGKAIANSALTGAGYGGLSSVFRKAREYTDVNETPKVGSVLAEGTQGALTGAALGAGLGTVGAGVGKAYTGLSKRIKKLRGLMYLNI